MLMGTVEVDVVDRFLAAVLAGSMSGADDLWTERTVLDATVPNWRFRCVGARAVSAEYATWFADPGCFESLRRWPAAQGAVVEYTLTWSQRGVPYAGHHVHLLTIEHDRIVTDTVMCGGRWPASLLAEMEEAGG
jgi:hypothetical protein